MLTFLLCLWFLLRKVHAADGDFQMNVSISALAIYAYALTLISIMLQDPALRQGGPLAGYEPTITPTHPVWCFPTISGLDFMESMVKEYGTSMSRNKGFGLWLIFFYNIDHQIISCIDLKVLWILPSIHLFRYWSNYYAIQLWIHKKDGEFFFRIKDTTPVPEYFGWDNIGCGLS